jgi:S1-C subfamily serine protease
MPVEEVIMKKLPAFLVAATLSSASAAAIAGTNTKSDTKATDPWSQVETVEWSSSSQGARLGVMVMSMTSELRGYFGAPAKEGVLVAKVEPGSAAAKAGIKVGDVLLSVKGESVDEASDVINALSDAKQGDRVKLAIVRDHKQLAIDATIGAATSANAQSKFDWLRRTFPWFDDWPAWPHRSSSS